MDLSIENLILEVTRKCNMCCDHCLRGPAEPLNMKPAVIRKVIQEADNIGTITFSGGEPSLHARAITLAVEEIVRTKHWPASFYVVTNGKIYSQAMVKALQRLYDGIKFPDLEPTLKISNDNFHDPVDPVVRWRYEELDFFQMEKKIDYFARPRMILNEGYAELNGLGGHNRDDNYEAGVDVIDYDNEVVIQGEIYINVHGDVIHGCDHSYENQPRYKLGNILQEPLLDILLRNRRLEEAI